MKVTLMDGDALIIVDVQNDFLPGGKLVVPEGDQILSVLNQYIVLFAVLRMPIFASRDWHPSNHCSFHQQGGPWPAHCIADSEGAAFPVDLKLPADVYIISKADSPVKDVYSAFSGTDLYSKLQSFKIKRVFVGGLATEYCVLNTVKDAIRYGYKTYILEDAIRAINQHPDDGLQALTEMKQFGAVPIHFEDIL